LILTKILNNRDGDKCGESILMKGNSL